MPKGKPESDMPDPVWFWQRIVSPHMAGLAAALAVSGREVVYVAERTMSDDRAAQGWRPPSLGNASLRLAPAPDAVSDAVRAAPANSVHICQGLRGNGLVGVASEALARRGLRRWIVLETLEDDGWRGLLRRLAYRRLIRAQRERIEGVLAIGHATPDWLAGRGMPRERIFPFTYFLPEPTVAPRVAVQDGKFRTLYVGSLIELKRVDLLIDAVAALGAISVELEIVGNGPLEESLRARAVNRGLPVRWLGRKEISEIPALMAEADCLVLPSRYDGWGAVVSEALMVGTPAICSDACGAAGVVRVSGAGGVFPTGNMGALASLLKRTVSQGRQTPERRMELAGWARCLGANAGADYLARILDRPAGAGHPPPPWIGA
jgi:glycosyltransferase involved in cell wall biosynthesis